MTTDSTALPNGPPAPPQPRRADPAPPPEHMGAINILLVDDEPKNLTVLETVLDDPAYRLVRAESADQALLALVGGEFAVIILDVRMPGMTGFELAKMIKDRKRTARVPIIFLTAFYNEDQHALEGYGTGAVDYLHKPVNPAVLRSKVAVFADLHRKNYELEAANRALLVEVAERRRAEEQLRELNDTLEDRVAERTRALRESEARMRLAQDAARVGTFDWDIRTGRYLWTPELEAMHGLPVGGFAGTPAAWESLLLAEDRADAIRLVERAFDTGQPVEGEWRVTWPDGSVRWLMCRFQVFSDGTGAPARMTGVNIDITERKKAEEAIREADRRKDEFLATLAHELRNPLAPVQNAVHILRMKMPVAPELQWANDVLDRQLRAITRLIDDLMDVSRISRGRIELRRTRVDLTEVLLDAVESARPLIDQRGHELRMVLPSEPIPLDADPTRLVQVFLNLLNNAAKFTAPGGRIDLTAERQGGDAVVSVKDTGVGIPAANLESIFEMFSQVEGALARSHGGLGIGLCLVKRLVNMHGGQVKAKSPGPDRGSEFLIRLPIGPERSPPCEPADHSDDGVVPASGLRILVVDDNRDAADSLAMLLGLQGHQVRVAYAGVEALEMTTSYAPDVVFLDIGMPGMDGFEVARRIRQQPGLANVVLVALTGWGQQADRSRTAEAGFNHHLVKPPDPKAVESILASLPKLINGLKM
jgi:PAS domain S-box-containing protein